MYSGGALLEDACGAGGVVSADATVIVLDESVIDKLSGAGAVEVAEMRMVYVPSATRVPAVFVPSQIFDFGFVTGSELEPELGYSVLILVPLADIILMDAFTCSENSISIDVVVARPDSTEADGYMVSCETV